MLSSLSSSHATFERTLSSSFSKRSPFAYRALEVARKRKMPSDASVMLSPATRSTLSECSPWFSYTSDTKKRGSAIGLSVATDKLARS